MKWSLSRIVIGVLIAVVIAGAGAVGAMKWFWPGAGDRRPKLVDVPPLSPVTRNSVIVTAHSNAKRPLIPTDGGQDSN
jgi:hypothetical protein